MPTSTIPSPTVVAETGAASPGWTRRRVLVVTYDFPPSPWMGAQACAQIARYLPLYGWEPVVLTIRERHVEERDVPGARAFRGAVIRTGVLPHPLTLYRRVKASLSRPIRGAQEGGDPVARMGTVRRGLLSLLSIPDACAGWIPPAVVAGLGAIRAHRVEHIFSSGPHSTNHLVGLALARMTGLPWTAHFRDPWVYPAALWRQVKPVSALSARIETALERMVVHRATAVACVTGQHASWLRQTYPDLPPGKFVTIPNGFDGGEWETLVGETDRSHSVSRDTFVISYAGNLYHRRSPLPLFRALGSLIHAGEIARERVRVDLIGHCDVAEGARVAETAAACGLAGCVNVTGPLSRAEALRRVARSDLLLLLAEGLMFQIPGKTYEYLRAGRPILALTSEGAVADLLRRAGGAWVVDPADEAAVRGALRDAYCSWKDGLEPPGPDPDLVAAFDRRVLVGRLARLFETAAASGRAAR
ncbi:MAG: glycosyltransferase [Candidatus Rokubacteria bacterium]|nr:glycosyltransferase [Candidatus Rokubacteria bacterium]